MTTVLLVGKHPVVDGDPRDHLAFDVDFEVAATLHSVREILARKPVAHVIMGGGLDLDIRLQVVRAVLEASEATTVHMKDRASGPQGYLPFVRRVLGGLRG